MSTFLSPLPVVAAVLFALSLAPAPARAEERTALTSIGVAADIDAPLEPDDPGLGGGFDARGYFENLLDGTIASCTRRIETVVEGWVTAYKLVVTTREETPSRLLVHAMLPTRPGFFEVAYRFDADRKRARVTLFFVGGDGMLHEPNGIRAQLNAFGIAAFQDALRNAILCKAA